MLIASSVRPAPMSPAMPTTSPARTVKAGVVDDLAVLRRVPDGPVLDAEHLLAGVRRPVGVEALQVAADHAADDPLLGDLAGRQCRASRPSCRRG